MVEWSIAPVAIELLQPPSALGMRVVVLGVGSVLAHSVPQEAMARKPGHEMVQCA